MKFFLTLIIMLFMITNALGQPNSYEILRIDELNKIEYTKRSFIDTEYIIDYNAVFVTTFKDGSAMMRPPIQGGEEGLLFHSLEEMNKMIASKVYPVKGTGSFWEKEKQRIVNLPESMEFYCNKLSELLNFKIEITDNQIYLKQLSSIISNKLKTKKQPQYLKEYLSIYIGELLRQHVKGDWKLAIVYTFNIYYTPDIVKDKDYFDLWFIMSELEMSKYVSFDIEYILKTAKEKFNPYNKDRYAR